MYTEISQWVDLLLLFPEITAGLPKMAPRVSLENQNPYARGNSETGTVYAEFLALTFINLGLQWPLSWPLIYKSCSWTGWVVS